MATEQEREGYIRTGAILLGIYLGYEYVLDPLLVGLGLKDSANATANAQAEEAALKEWYAQHNKPTKSEAEWALVADQIYEDLRYTSLDDDKPDAAKQLLKVQNEADIATLVKMFGKRQEYAFGVPAGNEKNISVFVSTNLSTSAISQINNYYSNLGIKFRF